MENESIGEEVKAESADSGKTARSLLGLIATVGGLCLLYVAYPILTEGLGDDTSTDAATVTTGSVTEANFSEQEVVEVVTPVKKMPQAPEELKAWIPLVEAELPQKAGVSYSLIHLRMSQDSAKLLVDLEKTSEGGASERFDLILVRDDFGRYVSGLHEVPMRLYPPDSPKEEK